MNRFNYFIFLIFIFTISCKPSTDSLVEAIKKNNYLEVQRLIDKDVDLQSDNLKIQPLSLAIELNEVEIVYLLLEAGANPNIHISKDDNRPVLRMLIEKNDIDMISKFLDYGADANIQADNNGNSLLSWCIYENVNLSLIKKVIENDADVNFKNYDKETILGQAVYFSTPEVIELLIQNGADFRSSYFRGYSYYIEALMIGNLENALFLLNIDKDLNLISSKGKNPWNILARSWHENYDKIADYYLNHGVSLPGENFSGTHIAVEQRNIDCLKWFLENGVDPNLYNAEGLQAISYLDLKGLSPQMISNDTLVKVKNIKKLLLEYGADYYFTFSWEQ